MDTEHPKRGQCNEELIFRFYFILIRLSSLLANGYSSGQ